MTLHKTSKFHKTNRHKTWKMTEDDFDWLTVTFQGHSVNIQLTKWSSFILSYLALLIGPIFFVCQYIDHKLLTHTFYKIYKFYTWISWKYRKTILPYGTWEFFQCHTLQAEGHLVFCCLYPLEEAPLKIKSKRQIYWNTYIVNTALR